MQTVSTVGLDIAKSVFQVHCVDAADQVVIRRQLKRIQLVTFNGGSLPVLRDHAIVFGVAARGLAPRPYFNRYRLCALLAICWTT
jgi:hypothetical protein